MDSVEEKLAVDVSVYGTAVTHNIQLKTWRQRFWGAWQVLKGDAGILILRVKPGSKIYNRETWFEYLRKTYAVKKGAHL